MAKEEGWASVVEATKNGNASILAAVQNTAEATKNGNEKIVAASQNTAAVIEEGHKKSKLSFKGLLGGFAGIFKQNASAEKEKENCNLHLLRVLTTGSETNTERLPNNCVLLLLRLGIFGFKISLFDVSFSYLKKCMHLF